MARPKGISVRVTRRIWAPIVTASGCIDAWDTRRTGLSPPAFLRDFGEDGRGERGEASPGAPSRADGRPFLRFFGKRGVLLRASVITRGRTGCCQTQSSSTHRPTWAQKFVSCEQPCVVPEASRPKSHSRLSLPILRFSSKTRRLRTRSECKHITPMVMGL